MLSAPKAEPTRRRSQACAPPRFRPASKYGLGSPLPMADVLAEREAAAQRAAYEKRMLQPAAEGRFVQPGPGVEERRFVRPRPTAEDEHADELAAQKALLEGELGELRGESPPAQRRPQMPALSN